MAVEEVGARLSLKDRRRFSSETKAAAGDLERLGDAADDAGDDLTRAERKASRFGTAVGTVIGKGTGKAVRGLGSLGKRAGSAVASLGKAGLAGAAAGLVIGLPLLGKSLLDTASQLEATGNKARIVFGDQLPTVTAWADESAAKMGLTATEATGMAAGFADLLIPMGFAREQAAKMSTETLNLAGALSQWSGGQRSAAEVADILSAAMLGETDALKGLGIGLSAAEVESKLAAKGQDKLTGAALEQARALATQELILAKSTDAQAAYAKGGNKLLTAQARIGSAWRTLREQMAARFAPHAAEMLERLSGRLPALTDAAHRFVDGALPRIKSGLKSFGGKVSEAVTIWTGVSASEGKAGAFGSTVGAVIQGALVGFGEFVVSMSHAAHEFGKFVRWTLELVSKLAGELAVLYAGLSKIPGPMQDTFREVATGLAGVAVESRKAALGLDELLKPRTVSYAVVYKGAVAAGAAPARARAEAADGARATGGTVAAGRLYRINEQGVESFMPSVSGTVLSARRTAAHAPIPLSADAGGVVTDADGRVVHEHHVYLDGKQLTASVKSTLRTEQARR